MAFNKYTEWEHVLRLRDNDLKRLTNTESDEIETVDITEIEKMFGMKKLTRFDLMIL